MKAKVKKVAKKVAKVVNKISEGVAMAYGARPSSNWRRKK